MRVLVRTPNWLGDTVMALPALSALRSHFADEVLVAAAPSAFAPLLSAAAAVDETVLLSREHSGRRGRNIEAAQLRSGRFDLAVLLPNSFGSAWVARRAGIVERWGYATRARGWLLTRAVPRPHRRSHLHQGDEYLGLLRKLGIESKPVATTIAAPSWMLARARRLLEDAGWDGERPLIGMAPGAAYGHAKRWLPNRYARVAGRLADTQGAVVVLVGDGHDRDTGYAIESSLVAAGGGGTVAGVVNLIGRTDLSQLIGLLAVLRALISSDSGAMHLAAALGVPVAAIFGPTDDRLTAPVGRHVVLTHNVWCRPCFLRDCPIDHRCMTGISEDRVFQAVTDQLLLPAAGGRT